MSKGTEYRYIHRIAKMIEYLPENIHGIVCNVCGFSDTRALMVDEDTHQIICYNCFKVSQIDDMIDLKGLHHLKSDDIESVKRMLEN